MKPLSSRVAWSSESETPSALASVSIPNVQERRLRQVIAIIETEPSFSIRELAVKVSLSPAHLQRLFKQQTGTQLGSVVAERRLQKAAELLTVSNLSIKEIASAVGYRHHSSCVRAFQRRFARAPKYFRNHDDKGVLPTEVIIKR
jgi:transcriptional regulator GlxA family with amidase domain